MNARCSDHAKVMADREQARKTQAAKATAVKTRTLELKREWEEREKPKTAASLEKSKQLAFEGLMA